MKRTQVTACRTAQAAAAEEHFKHARGFATVVTYPSSAAYIGKPAPAFTADAVMPDGDIRPLSLADYKGKWVVLLYYPKGALNMRVLPA